MIQFTVSLVPNKKHFKVKLKFLWGGPPYTNQDPTLYIYYIYIILYIYIIYLCQSSMNLLVFSLTHHTKAPPPPAPAWRRRRWRSQPPPRSVPRRRWRRPRRRPHGALTSGAPPPRPPCELEHTPHGPGMGAFGWLKLRGDIRGYGMIWIWESIHAGICDFFVSF